MKTGIEWTDRTWNPVTGCTKISQGCKHCYAEALSHRLAAMNNPRYTNGFRLTLHPDKIREPFGWREPSKVFVNSMSDLLHRDVPTDFIVDCFRTMAGTPRHVYQILTKRPERWQSVTSAVLSALGRWPANAWPGTSIESADHLDRIEALSQAGPDGTIRMISAEPLLTSLCPTGPDDLGIRLMENGIRWVITGGESGHKARPAKLDWYREIRDACGSAGIAFFHKQHGGIGTTKAQKQGGDYATLDGVLHHTLPIDWPVAPSSALL